MTEASREMDPDELRELIESKGCAPTLGLELVRRIESKDREIDRLRAELATKFETSVENLAKRDREIAQRAIEAAADYGYMTDEAKKELRNYADRVGREGL